jgi:hypothetical protein
MNPVAMESYFFQILTKVSMSNVLTGRLKAWAYPIKVSTTMAMNRFKNI